MDVNKFKDDFSRLLQQYTAFNSALGNVTPDLQLHLTKQQIVDAVHETLNAALDVNLQGVSAADLKTPANAIVVTTPNAPGIPKIDYGQINDVGSSIISEESRSDVQMDTSEIDATPVADISKKMKNDDESRAWPGALEVTLTEEQRNFRESLQKELSKLEEKQRNSMYKTIEEARRDALNVLDKLEDIRDLLAPDLKPIGRLSSIMSLPKPQTNEGPSSNLRPTAHQRRSIQATRRSISTQQKRSDTSLTPTSRLSSVIRAPPCSPSDQHQQPAKPTVSFGSKLDPQRRSVSMHSLTAGSNSPSTATAAVTGKTRSSSKYAHVQSTIPKPISFKRKAT